MSRSDRIGPSVRRRVYDRWGGVCWLCGKALPFERATMDHFIPRAAGGHDGEANLRPAHRGCNHKRGAALPWAAVMLTTEERIRLQKIDEAGYVRKDRIRQPKNAQESATSEKGVDSGPDRA